MNSWYKSFTELNAAEKNGVAFRVSANNRGTSLVVIAPHGGGIEPGTSEIARAIAGWTYSFYTFDGIRLNGNELLHLTSTLFDEPKCLKLVQNSETVIAIHGCGGNEGSIYVGGLDTGLGNNVMNALKDAGFKAVRATAQFLGNQPENICNRGRSEQGVQLEITEGLRRSMFKGLNREGRRETRPPFREFVSAIKQAVDSGSRARTQLWGFFKI